ncbi:hypothetical protein U1Q18_024112 [Sarracenia purpurea var. burkii]
MVADLQEDSGDLPRVDRVAQQGRLKCSSPLDLWFGRSYSDGMKFMKIPRVKELINERDDEGNTALHLAIKNKDHEKAKLLLINTDNVNLKVVNKKGLTALDMCEFEDWKLSYKQVPISFFIITLAFCFV